VLLEVYPSPRLITAIERTLLISQFQTPIMKFVLLPILSVGFVSLNAQNLVPNSSFEEYEACPHNYNELKNAIPWFRSTQGTTDYFNACDTFHLEGKINAGVPNNYFGYQEAHTGQAYAEFV
jgi:hypothetical protein